MARTKTDEFIKALSVGVVRPVCPVVPFSETAGSIPDMAEEFGHSVLGATHVFSAASHAMSAGSQVVSTRQEAGARRSTYGTDVKPLKSST